MLGHIVGHLVIRHSDGKFASLSSRVALGQMPVLNSIFTLTSKLETMKLMHR